MAMKDFMILNPKEFTSRVCALNLTLCRLPEKTLRSTMIKKEQIRRR
jgi:hypothetical protein